MGLSGWTLTILLVAVSAAASIALFQLGFQFFLLPIVFIPFIGLFRRAPAPRCAKCGLGSAGNYCPNCGGRMRRK